LNIVEHINDINQYRTSNINAMLTDVCNDIKRLNVYNRNRAGALIYAVSDTPKTPGDTDFRDWRFTTWVSQDEYDLTIKASYFEYWIPIENDNYFLEKAYFHVYLNGNPLILLHTDPNESEISGYNDFKYKQSPHLHISSAGDPIKHSHFALNNGNLNHILSSLENLQISMQEGIGMINSEVLAKYIK